MSKNSPRRKKAVFLANELAGYFVACLNKMTEEYPIDAYVIKYPVHAVAPFQFNLKNDQLSYRLEFELTTTPVLITIIILSILILISIVIFLFIRKKRKTREINNHNLKFKS